MMKKTLLALLVIGTISCQNKAPKSTQKKDYPVQKSEAEWREELSDMSYYVLRQAGTEKPFTNAYDKNYAVGSYVCQGCGTLLYESQNKFDSGSGWPSFDRGIDAHIEYDVDYKLGYARTELKCAKCGGHLGHVFDDGPKNTTGKRHCINSAALQFIPTDEKK